MALTSSSSANKDKEELSSLEHAYVCFKSQLLSSCRRMDGTGSAVCGWSFVQPFAGMLGAMVTGHRAVPCRPNAAVETICCARSTETERATVCLSNPASSSRALQKNEIILFFKRQLVTVIRYLFACTCISVIRLDLCLQV